MVSLPSRERIKTAMFMGEYLHSIDNKNRVIIPVKFRDELGERFILTKGLDECLFVYPLEEWRNVEDKLKKLSFTRADARAFSRFFFSGACEVEVDKQGRILIPGNLYEYADLTKELMIIGVSSRVEIWDRDKWLAYSNKAAGDYEEIAEKITDLDLGI